MQPGREAALAPEGTQFLPGSDKGLLGQILRLGRVRAHSEAEPIDLGNMQPIELLEGCRITSLGVADEIGFRHGIVFDSSQKVRKVDKKARRCEQLSHTPLDA